MRFPVVKESAILVARMRIIILTLLFALTGCVTTSSGHLNPAYSGFSASNLAVVVITDPQDKALKAETEALALLKQSNIEVKGFTNWVPFTTEQSLKNKIKNEGFLYALFFASKSSFGRESTGSYTYSGTSGNGYSSGSVTESSRSYRDTKAVVQLYEVHSGNVIWTGESERSSIGGFAKFDWNATSGVIVELVEKLLSSGVVSSG